MQALKGSFSGDCPPYSLFNTGWQQSVSLLLLDIIQPRDTFLSDHSAVSANQYAVWPFSSESDRKGVEVGLVVSYVACLIFVHEIGVCVLSQTFS